MKIWIFTSWLENLSFLNTLKQYNHNIIVYMNQDAWPLDDKSIDFQEKYIKQAIDILLEKKVDKIILPPMWELKYKNENFILPIYQNIIKQSLKYSLVWKIWLLGNDLDMEYVQNYIEQLDYTPTKRQKNIKHFKWFSIYKKNIWVWKYNIIALSKRDWMIRKLIKTDLNRLLSFNIDTIIPTSYDAYHFENIINQKIKNIRFQKVLNWDFLDELLWGKDNKYTIEFVWHWNTNLFLKEKRWSILLK